MPQGTKISFVTWPDGTVDGESLTLAGQRIALRQFMQTFLPSRFFGPLGDLYVIGLEGLWKSAKDHGFKVHTIAIGKDGQPTLEVP
jgi:hypothetical protein